MTRHLNLGNPSGPTPPRRWFALAVGSPSPTPSDRGRRPRYPRMQTSDLDTLSPSLRAKLQQLADGLTEEEGAQLSTMWRAARTGGLSPSLQAKLEQGARALTPGEQVQVRRLVQPTRTGMPAGEEADADGYMIGAFNDGQGNKGRPQPVVGTSGGFDLDLQDFVNAVGFLAFTTGLLEGPGGLAGPAPQPGQP